MATRVREGTQANIVGPDIDELALELLPKASYRLPIDAWEGEFPRLEEPIPVPIP